MIDVEVRRGDNSRRHSVQNYTKFDDAQKTLVKSDLGTLGIVQPYP